VQPGVGILEREVGDTAHDVKIAGGYDRELRTA
jgi:hypothetical protein